MAMSKSQIAAQLAEKVGITKRESAAYLEALADLAYSEAKNGFTVPGLGKLVLVDRPASERVYTFGERKGQKYMVPATKVVRFRVAKAAKDAIVGPKKPSKPVEPAKPMEAPKPMEAAKPMESTEPAPAMPPKQ